MDEKELAELWEIFQGEYGGGNPYSYTMNIEDNCVYDAMTQADVSLLASWPKLFAEAKQLREENERLREELRTCVQRWRGLY